MQPHPRWIRCLPKTFLEISQNETMRTRHCAASDEEQTLRQVRMNAIHVVRSVHAWFVGLCTTPAAYTVSPRAPSFLPVLARPVTLTISSLSRPKVTSSPDNVVPYLCQRQFHQSVFYQSTQARVSFAECGRLDSDAVMLFGLPSGRSRYIGILRDGICRLEGVRP